MNDEIDLGPIVDRIRLLQPLLRDTLAAAARGLDRQAAAAKLGCRIETYDQRFSLLYRKIGIEHLGRGEKRRVALDAYRLYKAEGETTEPLREEVVHPEVPRGVSGGYGVASVIPLGNRDGVLDIRPLVLGPGSQAEIARARREGYELHGSFVHYQSLSDTAVSLTQMFLVKRRP